MECWREHLTQKGEMMVESKESDSQKVHLTGHSSAPSVSGHSTQKGEMMVETKQTDSVAGLATRFR